MKRLILLLLVLALTLTSAAFAQAFKSDPLNWNQATLDLEMQGVNIDQVEFRVPAVRLVLDYGVLQKQQRFNVVLPVTNTTGRTIVINVDPNNPSPTFGNGSVLGTESEPTDVRIPPGATRNVSWRFAVSDNAAEASNLGQIHVFTFGIIAEGELDTSPRNQVFGQTPR